VSDPRRAEEQPAAKRISLVIQFIGKWDRNYANHSLDILPVCCRSLRGAGSGASDRASSGLRPGPGCRRLYGGDHAPDRRKGQEHSFNPGHVIADRLGRYPCAASA